MKEFELGFKQHLATYCNKLALFFHTMFSDDTIKLKYLQSLYRWGNFKGNIVYKFASTYWRAHYFSILVANGTAG